MSSNTMVSKVEQDRFLILERVFSAPRDLVFKMFKDADHLKRWWGPRGWELPVSKMDFKQGGSWLYCMKCVDKNQGQFFGMEAWGKAVYEEIIEPKKIVYVDYFSDAEGNVNTSLPAARVVMEFIDLGDKTKIVSRSEYETPQAMKTTMDMGMLQGITETWDRLEETLVALK